MAKRSERKPSTAQHLRTNLPAGHHVAAPMGVLLQIFKPEVLAALHKRQAAQRSGT